MNTRRHRWRANRGRGSTRTARPLTPARKEGDGANSCSHVREPYQMLPCEFPPARVHALVSPWCRPIALLHAAKSREYPVPPNESALHLSIGESLDTRGVRPRNLAKCAGQRDLHYHRRPGCAGECCRVSLTFGADY